MGNRTVPFIAGEYYHIYNRGVEKRDVFDDEYDIRRFIRSMVWFNNVDPIGSLKQVYLQKNHGESKKEINKLVNIIAYSLNPNHFHLILEQLVDGGISEYMKRLSGGYTWHFNDKNKRSGVLFQGRFKSKHIDSNDYLTHLSAYVNLNAQVHKFSGSTAELAISSWKEYISDNVPEICRKDIVLSQFKTKNAYKRFAEESLQYILERREDLKVVEFGG